MINIMQYLKSKIHMYKKSKENKRDLFGNLSE